MTEQASRDWLCALLDVHGDLQQKWQHHDHRVQFISAFTASGIDAAALGVLARDLQRGGNTFSTFQVQYFQGNAHIVFEGYPGLRKHLTGTRYLAANPKVVSMGIGKLGALNAIKTGFVVSVIVSVAFHGLDQLMNDQRTWHHFVGGVAADTIYAVAISVGSWAVVSGVVGTAAMLAIGPILAVVAVGVGLTFIALYIDSHLQLAKKIAVLLEECEGQLKASIDNARQVKSYYKNDRIGFLKRLFAIPDVRLFDER
ncbi:hypothetical protein Q3O60_00400 [Alkalimonas collagenimarina]|uniref:Uncharacterized protein n=1 Tax=Alkalimonas collagenimarina TaxID=400390 RepID=A0ABT9GUF9_9GAMM|nr:hypothetical protein [Alkalimonas collagenimarina]MDP4534656.1 hypothetical protein [Alkalimonas collagenimarina]